MPQLTHDQWISHLRAVAGPGAIGEAPLALGATEAPFRAAVQGSGAASGAWPTADVTAETVLWRALVDPAVDVGAAIDASATGPLLPQGPFRTIEVWTEAELCAVHALDKLARARGRVDWRARVSAARDWHVDRTQPDNATNRPWALQVFLLGGTDETVHYAETLLHNAMSFRATPEPLSAWILLDAANELEKEREGADQARSDRDGP